MINPIDFIGILRYFSAAVPINTMVQSPSTGRVTIRPTLSPPVPVVRLRSVIFWIHLIAGVFVAAVVLIMSVTGVLLTYQKQMTLWADLRGVDLTPPAGMTPLSADSLTAVVLAREGKEPSAIVWRSFENAPVEFQFGREGRQYVSPYTGAVLSTGSVAMREFFSKTTDWHRWLAREGDSFKTGRAITGWSNLAFLLLVVTGFYLWWPRSLRWNAFKQVLWFRRGLAPKARDFNWHHVIGWWTAIPLAVVVASGVVISFPWASDLVYRAVGDNPPSRNSPPAAASASPGASTSVPDAPLPVVIGDPAALAAGQMPDWRAVSFRWPKDNATPLVYSIDRGMGGEPQKRGTLTLTRSGEFESWKPFESLGAGSRARSMMRFLHTGEAAGGAFGQTIAGLVSLGAVVLVYTGLALSLRRFLAWRRRSVRVPGTASAALPDGI